MSAIVYLVYAKRTGKPITAWLRHEDATRFVGQDWGLYALEAVNLERLAALEAVAAWARINWREVKHDGARAALHEALAKLDAIGGEE